MKPTIACPRASLFRRLLRRLPMRSVMRRVARSITLVVLVWAALETGFGGVGFGGELRAQTAVSPAIDEDRIASHYGLDIWQTQQGLPSDAILTMIQTSDGYIWGGTFNGLVRFDGSFFHVFNKANTPALINNSIIALFEDSRRALWIGVQEGGVVRYKDGVFTRFDEKSGLGNLIARAFCEDADGALLIGTNRGAYRLSENGAITERLFNSAPLPDRVNALRRDSAGTLWLGTDAGLIETRDGFFKRHKHAAALPRHFVTSLYGSASSSSDTLWIGTLNGLYILAGGKYQKFPLLDTAVAVRSLYRDRDGVLWIGAEQGLYAWRFARGGFRLKRLGIEDGMSDNMVYSIAQDKEGSLWFGTYYGGFNRLKKQTFRSIGVRDGLAGNVVYSMIETRDGSLWITTLGGAQRYKNGVFTTFTRKNGMASEEVRVALEDRAAADVVWIGTYNGLHQFVGGKLRRIFTVKDGLPSEKIRALLQSSDGTLWIGTTQGLAAFAGGRFRRYDEKDGLRAKSMMTLLEDGKGRLWIGTDGGGLYMLENGKFSHLGESEGLEGKIVFALAEDAAGQIWIGTKFGLHRYSADGRIRRIGAESGLQSEDILQIARGADGAMWIGTSVGVMRIAESELNAVADGKQKAAFSRLYNRFDGMATNNCNAPAFPCVTADKRIWFPTLRGLTAVDPLNVQFNAEPPPVTIERVQIDSTFLPASREVRIPAGAEKFTVRFVALSLIVPERVQFRYKLEGFDKDWSPAAAEREARYTNISPGEYTFRVIACNNDGVWNESGVAMRIVVEPFFYQTAWFIGLVALSLALGVGLGIRARTRRLQIKSRELERLVAQRTAELTASNEEIQRQLRVLNDQANEIAATNEDLEKRNAQLQELNNEKNEILGIVAHDLKNPISAARGLADLIQTGFVEGEKTREIAAQIVQTGDRMLELVKNLLDINRLEQGAMEFYITAFNAAPFVENSVWQYIAAAEAKDICLRFESEESFVEPMILADEQALMQILDNLISNAVKYSPRGKSVTARVKASAGSVRIEVQDEGPGITPEEMPLLFGKFVRLSARPTGGEHSTGLGLSIVKKLVEAMNGRVWCESEPGKGATFIVEFPRYKSANKPVEAAAGEASI